MPQYVKIQCFMRAQRHDKIKLCPAVLGKGFCNRGQLLQSWVLKRELYVSICAYEEWNGFRQKEEHVQRCAHEVYPTWNVIVTGADNVRN